MSITETEKWQLRESLNLTIYGITGKNEKYMFPSSQYSLPLAQTKDPEEAKNYALELWIML